jgi:hypothetical protein
MQGRASGMICRRCCRAAASLSMKRHCGTAQFANTAAGERGRMEQNPACASVVHH